MNDADSGASGFVTTRYDYHVARPVSAAATVHEAIRFSVLNYMHDQLGWSVAACDARVEMEEHRRLPRRLLDDLVATRGWRLNGARVLDVGAGQGGAVLELLSRGADAYGVEPGPEFLHVAHMRLTEAGHEEGRITGSPGEALPLPDESVDYVISLQVLEHVRDPEPILREIFRVLKPGGEAHIRCENYLSFREQHYRIPWLPLLPKWLGSLYLRLIGRKPEFLQRYVFYTTYPQIWRLCDVVGFANATYEPVFQSIADPSRRGRARSRFAAGAIRAMPKRLAGVLTRGLLHGRALCAVGVRVHLRRPQEPCP